MNGYKIRFNNGLDRLYKKFKTELDEAAQNTWIVGSSILGEQTQKLELEMARKYDRKYAVAVGSATDGLYFALRAHGIKKNHKIICPALSYIATAGAIRRIGCDINFVDTNDDGNIGDFSQHKNVDAIVYVNLYGNVVDYEKIKSHCDKNKILLVEDAAQSQGANYQGIPSGKLGDISVFSFDPMKNMPCFGSGGMVLTDEKIIFERLISLRRHGIYGNLYEYGYNSVISEDHAAQLNVLFCKFEELQNERKRVAERYIKNLNGLKLIKNTNNKNESSYHKFILLTEKRDLLQKYLAIYKIETKIHYPEILDVKNKGLYPKAEQICAQGISLPIYPFLENDEIDYICNRIKKFHGI
jgi:dTDP-4-amino-4,6-dideoxygalactose transaminase